MWRRCWERTPTWPRLVTYSRSGLLSISPDSVHYTPYVSGLVATLVNPDRGDFFADALIEMMRLQQPTADDASGEVSSDVAIGPLQITAFSEDPRKVSLQALDRVRQAQMEVTGSGPADLFHPQLRTVLRSLKTLEEMETPPEAHVTVIADYTRPRVVTSDLSPNATSAGSMAVHGLVTRFVPWMMADAETLRWRHAIVPVAAGRPEPHPAGPRYGDVLVDLHESILNAAGRCLGGAPGQQPALEVTLEDDRRQLLHRLHTHSSWVITLDRFFAIEFYDSPAEPRLRDIAEAHVLDYSPEFAEGLGHRLMVTTSWRDEIGVLLARAMDELGFIAVDQSVRQLLHYLKTVSGRLALQSLQSDTTAASVVGLGAVAAVLQSRGRLAQAVLVPIDLHPRLFSRNGFGALESGERRCDLVLVALKRNIVEATFIEVKWRRGNVSLDELGNEMLLQMESSAAAMRERFFDPERIDGALQRAYLANVLRFYVDRARRYGLLDPTAEASFLDHLSRLEKSGLQYRPNYEGFIVSLEQQPRKPFLIGDVKISLLTATDFEYETQLSTVVQSLTPAHPTDPESHAQSTNGSSGDAQGHSQGSSTADPSIRSLVDGPAPTQPNNMTEIAAEPESVPTEHVSLCDEPVGATERTDIRVALGEGADGEVVWSPSTKGSPHLFVIGIPGQGKSWTVSRILGELGAQGVPALVLDFHGQFADADSSFVRHAAPVLLDAAAGLPFSPFECTSEAGNSDWKVNTFAVAEIFAYVAGLGDMQRDVVYTAIKNAYLARGFGDASNAGEGYPTLSEVLAGIEQQEQLRRVSNVTARCRPLLEMDLFRPESTADDLLSTIRGGLVIDLHNLYVETLQLAAGAFILRKVYKDMFRWGIADHLRLVIVLDEAHRLARDVTLPKIMKEGRKFGIAVIVASQGMSDFHPDVLGNAGTKIIFRTNYPESRKLAGYIRARQSTDVASRIEQLSVGSAYVQTPDMPYGVQVQMYPLENTQQ